MRRANKDRTCNGQQVTVSKGISGSRKTEQRFIKTADNLSDVPIFFKGSGVKCNPRDDPNTFTTIKQCSSTLIENGVTVLLYFVVLGEPERGYVQRTTSLSTACRFPAFLITRLPSHST
jgi:hypothetical protein